MFLTSPRFQKNLWREKTRKETPGGGDTSGVTFRGWGGGEVSVWVDPASVMSRVIL